MTPISAGKIYGCPFGADVAFGDPIFGIPQPKIAADILAFAGNTPPTLLVHPIETHIAEKLYAYTLPRAHTNSRVKHLPEPPLLASAGAIGSENLRQALEQTFSLRGTHALPVSLPHPPRNWKKTYEAMAQEHQLLWRFLDAVLEAARTFFDPILSGDGHGAWEPELWE